MRYMLCVLALNGRYVPAPCVIGYESPVVILDADSLSLYTPIRWVRYRGPLH